MKKVRARDVAERAGVSISAVSRAFTPGSALSEDKRQIILKAARELGYATPSAHIASRWSTGAVALVMGDISNPFYPAVLEAFSQKLIGLGRRLILHIAPSGRDVDAIMAQVLEYRVDAAVITSATLSSTLATACKKQNLPVVLLNRSQPEAGISAVSCDNYAGGRLIAKRMLDQGRQRIGFIGGLENTSTHLERWRGFSEVLDEAGMPLHVVGNGAFAYDAAFAAIDDILSRPKVPDALFCANDVMALAAIDVAKRRGMVAGEDLAIIGFDDIPMADWQSYRLTTVRQRIRQMIDDTMTLIDQITDDPSIAGSTRLVPGRLIERDTG